ncbi:hypothetical protein YC2023_095023 [Brassica napus]
MGRKKSLAGQRPMGLTDNQVFSNKADRLRHSNQKGRFGVAKVKSRLGVSVSGLVHVRLDESDDNSS